MYLSPLFQSLLLRSNKSGWRKRIWWRTAAGKSRRMIQIGRIRPPHRSRPFYRGYYQPAQSTYRTQTRIDGAVLNFFLGGVPVRKDDGASAAASLGAGLFGSCKCNFRRTQVVNKQQVR